MVRTKTIKLPESSATHDSEDETLTVIPISERVRAKVTAPSFDAWLITRHYHKQIPEWVLQAFVSGNIGWVDDPDTNWLDLQISEGNTLDDKHDYHLFNVTTAHLANEDHWLLRYVDPGPVTIDSVRQYVIVSATDYAKYYELAE